MKKTLLLGILFLSTGPCLKLEAQTSPYISLVDSGATWVATYECAWWNGTDQYGHTIVGHSYSFESEVLTDTVLIQGIEYRKLMFRSLPQGSLSLIGYLREDSSLRKVFYWPKDSLNEITLYDFSKQIGDTIHSVFRRIAPDQGLNPDSCTITISGIDTVTYGYIVRRRFTLQTVYHNHIIQGTEPVIEGIGGLGGLLDPIWINQAGPDPCWKELNCFGYKDTTIYPAFSIGECVIILPVGIQDLNTQSIHLYPNPANDLLHLSSPEAIQYNTRLIITDLIGQNVYSSHISQSETTHDISTLPQGIYTWRLASDNGILKTGKIIKQ